MNVELIYERSCPNVEAARTRLIEAFHRAGLPFRWCEWEVGEPDTPQYARDYGSPTILIGGRDVSGNEERTGAQSCRLYTCGTGYEPVPPVEKIVGALRQAADPGGSPRLGFAVLPSVGVALLPKLTCPVCWPAYTALLGSVGIGFVNYTPYLVPIMAVVLAVTLSALAYRATARRGYGPFWLGALGSGSVLVGKFVLESEPGLYAGVALLLAASVWNIWPRRRQALASQQT